MVWYGEMVSSVLALLHLRNDFCLFKSRKLGHVCILRGMRWQRSREWGEWLQMMVWELRKQRAKAHRSRAQNFALARKKEDEKAKIGIVENTYTHGKSSIKLRAFMLDAFYFMWEVEVQVHLLRVRETDQDFKEGSYMARFVF